MVPTARGTVTSSVRNLASRARGVFLGAAVGDALGWPQEQNSGIVGGNQNRHIEPKVEFRAWARYGGSQYQKYVEPVEAGAYSDDTQLILATARALQTIDWFATLTNTELPQFLLYQRGAGGATLRSCRSWANGQAPWEGGTTQKAQKAQRQYFAAGGNGVAMRIGPHAIACASGHRDELVARVVTDGAATHGHPRALVGAAAYAVALHLLLTTEGTLEYGELAEAVEADDSWQQPRIALGALPEQWVDAATHLQPDIVAWWETAVHETRQLLSRTQDGMKSGILGNDLDVLEKLGCFDRRVNGAGTVSAIGAIYLASRNAPRPMSGLVRAAFMQQADTDTMASMTAGLLGALHGPDWLGPLASSIQDRAYLEELADRCTRLALGERREADPAPQTVRDRDLKTFRDALIRGSVTTLPSGHKVREIQVLDLESRTNAHARRWVLHVDSQTMTIDLVQRSGSEQHENKPKDAAKKQETGFSGLRLISLLALDIDEIENFYGKNGLGLHIRRSGPGEIYIGNVLRVIRASPGSKASGRPILLDVQVDDLDPVLARLGATRTDADTARLKDPAGNDVWVTQTKK